MEPSPPEKVAPLYSEKFVITGSGGGIGSISPSMEGDGVGFGTLPPLAKSEATDLNQITCNEVNKAGNTKDPIVVETFTEDSKGEMTNAMPSGLSQLDVIPTNMVHSSEGFDPFVHNLTMEDESNHDMNFSDDDGYMNDEEFAVMQAHFDSLDISPGVEAPIPWWPSHEGTENQSVSASNTAFFNPDLYNNAGTSTGTALTGFYGSNYSKQPFPMPSSGEKPPFNDTWQSASHIQHKLATWTTYSMLPSGKMAPSSSDAKAGKPYFQNKMLHMSKTVSTTLSGDKNYFTGWKFQGEDNDELNFPAGDLTQHNFTDSYMGGFSYMQDPSLMLDQGITAEISVPTDLASSNEMGNSEAEIVQKLESFKKFDTVQDHSDHHYSSSNQYQPSKDWVKKIQEEWRILEKDLPDTIFVRVYETRMDLLRAVIIGADGTPYHDGMFFFDFHFPPLYPDMPPLVHYRAGGLRLNPNLYNSGKVCLSLLNTWSGDKNEMWVPGVSTVLQILVSIQGLILNVEPYYNEPGYEVMAGTPEGVKWSRKYSENAYLLSLKTMLYSMRQPPKHFEDIVFGHFYTNAHNILLECKAYLDGGQVGALVKGAIQEVEGGEDKKKTSCSHTFKMHLPLYINSLVKAFTKIGVADCEKYTVVVNNDAAVPAAAVEKPSSSSNLHGFKSKVEQKKVDNVVGESSS